ncbi:hypothetical protein BJX63DRAFT_431015 [Aspergillus granulosus]|uniref:Uncharacterized protein n=1 Tax=Aspergillus granulosus TaxID=176169 RepID=A0ABR4HI86_9EURO
MPDAPNDTTAEVTTSDGHTTYYLCQDNEELFEEQYSGGFEAPMDVGVARPGTNAAYLLVNGTVRIHSIVMDSVFNFETKRAVYCLGEGGTLKDFEFDPDQWQWTEGNLEARGFAAAPDTHFEAVLRGGKHREVFFQSLTGQIASVRSNEGQTWELCDAFPATNASAGASLCFLQAGDREYLFYAHQQNSIHALVFDRGGWEEERIGGSPQGFPVHNIYAELQETGYRLQFCDQGGGVYILAGGETVRIGSIVHGEFKRDNDAQADRLLLEIKAPPKVKGAK